MSNIPLSANNRCSGGNQPPLRFVVSDIHIMCRYIPNSSLSFAYMTSLGAFRPVQRV